MAYSNFGAQFQAFVIRVAEVCKTFVTADTLTSALANKLDKTATAASATKATQDASGNIITSTYATKTELNSVSSTASSAASTANTAKTSAESAVSTANTAKTTAESAVSTANTAKSTANTAKSTADSALAKANTAVQTVNGTFADANGNVTLTVNGSSAYQIPYATCSTSGTTGAKVATVTNGVSLTLVAGAMVVVKFSNAPVSSGNASYNITSLNVNSTGAQTVKKTSRFGTYSYFGQENNVYLFVYDGTYWNAVTPLLQYQDLGGN